MHVLRFSWNSIIYSYHNLTGTGTPQLKEPLGDYFLEDARPPEGAAADVVRWIDTDIMICDPMTKAMSSKKLYAALDANFWDLKQPIEAQMLAERYLDGIQLIALPGIVCRIQVVVLQLSKAHHLQVRMQPP